MKIEYRVGNLLDTPSKFIMHGCNAQGVMGSGVAKAIRATYPQAYEKYAARHAETPLQVGEVISVDCGRHIVFNGITQEFFGSDGKQYVDYTAVGKVIQSIDTFLYNWQEYHETKKPETVAMPLIGAGLGGGKWELIERIIEEFSPNFRPVVYVLNEDMIPEWARK